jgi:hypothetical protein
VTAVLPQMMLFDGTVRIDAAERELVVRPASTARPWARVLWDETVRTMVEQSRRGGGHSLPTPWASGAGRDQIRYGIPDRDGSLKFRFHRGEGVYKTLVGTPGLRARIALDRSNGRISVRFLNRRKD